MPTYVTNPHPIHRRKVWPEPLASSSWSRIPRSSPMPSGMTRAAISPFTMRARVSWALENSLAIQVRAQRVGDRDMPIRLLVRLEQADEGPGQRHAGAVQRMEMRDFLRRGLPVPEVRPAGLERLEVAAAGHFQILVQPRG